MVRCNFFIMKAKSDNIIVKLFSRSQADQHSHAETPKYRCPRCKAQTCSLPCYKRHQQRASCDGARDPSAYMRKSQLATPAGVDHDYNYLKSVERNIDSAGRDLRHRGVGVDSARSKAASRAWQPESAFQRYLARNRITVDRAPKGMSRQKTNHTRSTNNGNIIWTVEWINGDGNREIHEDCSASEPIASLYAAFQIRKRHSDSVNSEGGQRGTKRKRKQTQSSSQARDERQDQSQSMEVEEQAEEPSASKSIPIEVEELQLQLNSTIDAGEDVDGKREPEAQGAAAQPIRKEEVDIKTEPVDEELPILNHHSKPSPTATVVKSEEPSDQPTSSPENYYYLLKPGAMCASRVLIQLSPTSSITESLQDQRVREYPTIYVLPDPPDDLRVGFMLEKEYKKIAPRAALDVSKSMETHHRPQGNIPATTGVDAKSILSMLKRDLVT